MTRCLFIPVVVVMGVLEIATLTASAQDFRVHTTVTDLNNPKRGGADTCITLFHAGKVYDYIAAAEETVIYEPAHSRFLVLNKRHNLTTEISQDEIRRYLELAQKHAREILLAGEGEGKYSREQLDLLEFQVLPSFDIKDDPKAKRLTLSSPVLTYRVVYAEPPAKELAATYLKAADWTAQLNAVMHPQALLPQARLTLNEELRKRNVIPRVVELEIQGEHPMRRRAEHNWTWSLIPIDLKLIDYRESLMRQPDFRTIPFTEFQREMLTTAARR